MGEKKHLLAVVGNNSSKSYNRKLLYAMKELFGNDVDFVIQEIKGLPPFSEDLLDDVPADAADEDGADEIEFVETDEE